MSDDDPFNTEMPMELAEALIKEGCKTPEDIQSCLDQLHGQNLNSTRTPTPQTSNKLIHGHL